ncbi:MAG: hypothetical protein DIU60_019300 [Actinomycetes bacterium]|jgi:hypothetical protein
MARLVLAILGAVLALFVLFSFVIPALFALLKLALVLGLIGLIVFLVVTFVGKSSTR